MFHKIGGRICLDFANTLVSVENKGDEIRSWRDLMDFLWAFGIVSTNQINQLKELESTVPDQAAETLRAALEMRQGMRRAFQAIANRQMPTPESVEPVNRILRFTEGYEQLAPQGNRWGLQLVQREKRLEWLLAAIARSAADLIVEGQKAPVRKCANPACVLYFYDTSRTGKRRWCSMAVCGNRSKVAAFARRRRKKGTRAK